MKENKDDMTWKFLFDEHNYCKDLHEYVGHKHPELKEPITPFEINPFLWDSEVYIRERDTTLSDSKRLNDAYDRLDDMLFAKLEKIKMTPTFDLIAKKMIFGHYESPNSGKFLIDKINIDDMLRTNEGRTTILEKMKTDKSTHSMVFFGTFKLVDGEKDEIEIR